MGMERAFHFYNRVLTGHGKPVEFFFSFSRPEKSCNVI